MIKITKRKAPDCLEKMQGETYNDLKDDCNKDVRASLKEEQKGLCAYCQRSIKNVMTIEHYIPQTDEEKGKDLVLEYTNFLGVCSGKYYINRKTGEKIIFCESKRGNLPLTINPQKQEDINTLYYDENYKICSTNLIFQQELDDTLYLNFDELCLERIERYDKELRIVQQQAILLKLTPLETYQKALRYIKATNPEYSGFLLYRFNKLVTHYNSKKTD